MALKELQPRELRSSGILNPPEQKIAQELFDCTFSNGGRLIKKGLEGLSTVAYAGGTRKQAMALVMEKDSGIERFVLSIKKGRRGWQDDGFFRTGTFLLGNSGIKSTIYHPSPEKRDGILKQFHNILIKPQAK